MAIRGREYVHRVNNGGNFCGHDPKVPRLDLIESTNKNRPKILQKLQERTRTYFSNPQYLPSLNAANKSSRQQRSERREACLLALSAILEFTDLTSLRCGIPTSSGFLSLTLDYLCRFTGMGQRRMERAVADLKAANILTISQPRQLKSDGSWRGLAAVKAVSQHLFTAFGLSRWLAHERDRANKRLAKKAKKSGSNLTHWARNRLFLGRPQGNKAQRGYAAKRAIDNETWERARLELMLALKESDPGAEASFIRTEADRILSERYGSY